MKKFLCEAQSVNYPKTMKKLHQNIQTVAETNFLYTQQIKMIN